MIEMTEQPQGSQPQPTDPEFAFAQLVAPMALDQAEKALAKVVATYVAKIAGMKLIQPYETIRPAMDMGQFMLIEFAQSVYGLSYDQASSVIRDAIHQARHGIRKAA